MDSKINQKGEGYIFREGFAEQLVLKFRPVVQIYSYYLTGSWNIAKKITERSFQRTEESFDQYDPTQSLGWWVLKQTTDIFLDFRGDLGVYMDSVGPDFFASAEKKLGLKPAEVQPALLTLRDEKLSHKEFVVLGLFRLMDVSLKGISDTLQWKYPTVKGYSQRSQEALENWFRENREKAK